MPFCKKLNCDFKIENNQIILDKNYLEQNRWRFKKITGSRFANVLGMGKYSSPAKTWAMMTNIYKEEMDETLALVGNTVEPKIRDYVQQVTNVKYIVYDPKKVGWDVFKENKVFGGIPDGEPLNSRGEVDYSSEPMLEIKTTSIDAFVYKKNGTRLEMQKDESGTPLIKERGKKRQTWFDKLGEMSISNEYQMQLGLYLYLRNTTRGLFAVGFLEPSDYVSPEKFDASKREIRLVDFSINREAMRKYIERSEQWYHDHIDGGISPKLSPDDHKWLHEELGITL